MYSFILFFFFLFLIASWYRSLFFYVIFIKNYFFPVIMSFFVEPRVMIMIKKKFQFLLLLSCDIYSQFLYVNSYFGHNEIHRNKSSISERRKIIRYIDYYYCWNLEVVVVSFFLFLFELLCIMYIARWWFRFFF